MIHFNFQIDWLWSDRWDILFLFSGLLGHDHAWEFNGYATHQIVDLSFSYTRKCDHAGIMCMIGLFGYSIEFNLYDTRHYERTN